MTDVHTHSLRLSKQQTATNNLVWGSVLNAGVIALLDDALAGTTSIDVTAGNVTLSTEDGAADQARCMTILVIGAPGVARTIFVPNVQKVYTVHNACGQSVTVKTTTGVGVVVPNGSRATVFVDEASGNVIQPLLHTDQAVLALSGNLTAAPCTVVNGTAGTTTPTYYVGREGGQVIIGTAGYTVTLTAPAFIVNINAGTFPVSSDLDARTLYIVEAGTVREAVMTTAPSSIIYSRADTSGWGSNSVVVPEHYFVLRGA